MTAPSGPLPSIEAPAPSIPSPIATPSVSSGTGEQSTTSKSICRSQAPSRVSSCRYSIWVVVLPWIVHHDETKLAGSRQLVFACGVRFVYQSQYLAQLVAPAGPRMARYPGTSYLVTRRLSRDLAPFGRFHHQRCLKPSACSCSVMIDAYPACTHGAPKRCMQAGLHGVDVL